MGLGAVITADQRNVRFLKEIVNKIWKVIVGAEKYAQSLFPQLKNPRYPDLPEKLTFLHAEDILEMFPTLPRKQRETTILQEHPAIFIIGIGWPLRDGYPHEMRAADYDDWVSDTRQETGEHTHGLNGDILVWNPVTKRHHELTSMGIRVTADTLKQQLTMSNQLDFMKLPYHQAILNNRVNPSSIVNASISLKTNAKLSAHFCRLFRQLAYSGIYVIGPNTVSFAEIHLPWEEKRISPIVRRLCGELQ